MTHDELLKRLREATGEDRELDGLIEQALGILPSDAYWSVHNVYGDVVEHWVSGPYGAYNYHSPEELTASLDAAIALVEKMLPGANWRIQFRDGTYKSSAIISREHPTKHFDVWVDRQGATPALALLIALLEALSAKGEPKP